MDESLKTSLKYLGLKNLESNWDTFLKQAQRTKPSYQRFLVDV